MKLTQNEISNKIKSLKPLNLERFEVFEIQSKTLAVNDKIPNHAILKELDRVYENHFNSITLEHKGSSKALVPQKLWEVRESFYKTKVSELTFRNSSTFFSPQFEKKTKDLLSGKKYKTLTEEEVSTLNHSLQSLSTVEFEWKEYHKRTVTKETAHDQFKKEFEEFEKQFNLYRFPSDDDLVGQRSERKFMPYKMGIFAKSFVDFLSKDQQYKPLHFLSEYPVEILGDIIVKALDARRVFNDLAKISIKKAHEKLLNQNERAVYDDNVLSLDRVELVDDFTKVFTIEVLYTLLNYGETVKSIDPEVANILSRDVQIEICHKNLLTSITAKNKESVLLFSDLIQSVLHLFLSSDFFSKIVSSTSDNSKGKPITTIQLVLPDKLEVTATRPLKFPNIVRPHRLKKKDVDSLVKPLINGKGDLTKSNNLVMALNISRSKPHKVNELLLRLIKEFFKESPTHNNSHNILTQWLLQGDIDLKTLHRSTISKKEEELRRLKSLNDSTNISLRLANTVVVQLSKRYNIAIKFTNILHSCGITKVERSGYYGAKELDTQITSEVIGLKYSNSRIFLAELLRTFPIYITDLLCIRLRKYPREHWLSRTAGEFKHLLENFTPRKLTLKGLRNLLTAYYRANSEMSKEFEFFLNKKVLSKKKGFLLLYEYFKTNPLDFTLIKKPMYFLNLHLSLLQASNENNYTGVNVEVDQNASALVILSLVLRSRKMAESCNVLGLGVKVSPYDFIRSKAKEYFDGIGGEMMFKKQDTVSEYDAYFLDNMDVIEFICNSRKLHKYAIMCFCYNQTALGRMDDFTNHWLEEFNYSPNGRQRKFLNLFASCYPDFVEFVYPNTKRKLEILKEVIGIVCQEAPKVSIRTLDGEVINWAFYATKVQKRKYYDVIEQRHKSYHASVLKERSIDLPSLSVIDSDSSIQQVDDFPKNLQLDSLGMKRKFLSYLIHSIDASILRRIINKMKIEHKSSVNHLHDCVILHPNDLNSFYKVIKDIYSTPDIYNVIEYGVFNQIESSLSPEGTKKLDELKIEFFSLTDDFESELANMNPQHMYSLED